MATFIQGTDIGNAWLHAFEAIHANGGSIVNLAVEISDPRREDLGVRRSIEVALMRMNDSEKSHQSIHTVANTIFPIALYRPEIEGAAERFIANALKSEFSRRHAISKQWGSYLGRLVAYPSRDGKPTNQLEFVLRQLRSGPPNFSDLYEVPILAPGKSDEMIDWDGEARDNADSVGAVLHGDVRADARWRGGPCLAHISLTLEAGAVSMVALYRRHSYIPRAYGNFLGLARLLVFLSVESGHDVGNLLVVTGHAVDDAPGRKHLLDSAKENQGEVADIEWRARSLGASWSDLELATVKSSK